MDEVIGVRPFTAPTAIRVEPSTLLTLDRHLAPSGRLGRTPIKPFVGFPTAGDKCVSLTRAPHRGWPDPLPGSGTLGDWLSPFSSINIIIHHILNNVNTFLQKYAKIGVI